MRYEVDTDLEKVIECNCSHCEAKGLLLAFVMPEAFRLLQGSEEELADYQFNTKNIHHLFCPTCGVQSWAWGTNAEGEKMISINVRCLDDIDLAEIERTPVNGKDY